MTAARVLRSFGHDVLAAGLAGGTSGELIREDLARSGVPTAFTAIRGESRRVFRFTGPAPAGQVLRFGEPGPYITTEELGRFAADYRSLLAGAAAVVLCGSLPDGLPPEIYGTLVTYAVEAGVPVILDAGGEELRHAVSHGPDLVVAETSSADPGLGAALIRLGAAAAAVATGHLVRAVSAEGEWTARVTPAAGDPAAPGGPGRAGRGPGPRPAARLVLAGPAPARPGPGRRRAGRDRLRRSDGPHRGPDDQHLGGARSRRPGRLRAAAGRGHGRAVVLTRHLTRKYFIESLSNH